MPRVKILRLAEVSEISRLFDCASVPEGSLEWFQTVAQSTLRPNEEVLLVVANDSQGVAQAALPLVRGKGGRLRALSSPYTTNYVPAFPDAHWARFLGSQAQRFVPNLLQLDALDFSDQVNVAFMQGLKSSGLVTASFSHFQNWHDDVADFNLYWSKRPAQLKSTVRRKLATLQKNHSLDFRVEVEGEKLEKSLAAYLDVYRSSWKSAEPHPQFIETLVRRLSRDRSIRLGTLAIDGIVVAAQIWLLRGERATIFKLAHRQDAVAHSPGTLLTYWMLEKLVREEAIRAFDFGRGNDCYKRDWLSQSRHRYGVIAANWRSLVGLMSLVSDVLPTRLSNFMHSKRLRQQLPSTNEF